MQKNLTIALAVGLFAVTALLVVRSYLGQRPTAEAAVFVREADDLIEGLQAYRKFVGTFPSGSAADIANELSGKSEKKVLVMAAKQEKRNAKGEVTDPWGTPVQYFFGPATVLVRSAGPNRTFEDHGTPGCDDLFRTDAH